MEWEAVGIVLSAVPFGEADAVVTLLTEENGAHRGLARGARSRGSDRSTWEIGNILRVRWAGRLADQLGIYRGEILQAPSSYLFDAPLGMAALASTCAVASGVLPERAAYPVTYAGLVNLLALLAGGRPCLPAVVRWEAALLGELGYGLDLSRCAVTGEPEALRFVSPRSGCAVSEAGAGKWQDRLFRLPAFMLDEGIDESSTSEDWRDGLTLTGHFLARDAFGHRHHPIPALRVRLSAMLERSSGR